MKNTNGLKLGWGWNRGTKGVMKPNRTSFKKGQSVSPSTQFTKGNVPKKTPAQIAKIAASNTGQKRPSVTGANNPNWKGGVTSQARLERVTTQMEMWRKAVFARDNYTCQTCGVRGVPLHADHELPFSLFPALRTELLNGRTLCVPCHRQTFMSTRRLKLTHLIHE